MMADYLNGTSVVGRLRLNSRFKALQDLSSTKLQIENYPACKRYMHDNRAEASVSEEATKQQ
jgi:hypothetical protein